MKIQLTTQKQTKVGSKFITTETENETIDFKTFNLLTNKDTLKWFRNLGGSETTTKEYTSRGYNITKLVSTSPNKQERTIRTFDFDYKEEEENEFLIREREERAFDDTLAERQYLENR